MNLPNRLTLLRVIMIPFFVVFLLWDGGETALFRYISAAIFIVASLAPCKAADSKFRHFYLCCSDKISGSPSVISTVFS